MANGKNIGSGRNFFATTGMMPNAAIGGKVVSEYTIGAYQA